MNLRTLTMPCRAGKHGGVGSIWSGQPAQSDDDGGSKTFSQLICQV